MENQMCFLHLHDPPIQHAHFLATFPLHNLFLSWSCELITECVNSMPLGLHLERDHQSMLYTRFVKLFYFRTYYLVSLIKQFNIIKKQHAQGRHIEYAHKVQSKRYKHEISYPTKCISDQIIIYATEIYFLSNAHSKTSLKTHS